MSAVCRVPCAWLQLVHESVYDTVVARLLSAYGSVPAGDPLVPGMFYWWGCGPPGLSRVLFKFTESPWLCMTGTLLGPLHTKGAIKEYTDGLAEIKKQGGRVLFGGNVVDGEGFYVQPTIVEIDPAAPIVKTELFVPILYVMKFKVRARVAAKTPPSLRVRRVGGVALVGRADRLPWWMVWAVVGWAGLGRLHL